MHTCPMVDGVKPHVGGPILPPGCPTVLIGGMPAARMGDPTSHGGVIVAGCPTVIIGSSAQAETLKTDEPFCEECERKRKEREARQERRG